jgi:anti-sigma B factor antagonist
MVSPARLPNPSEHGPGVFTCAESSAITGGVRMTVSGELDMYTAPKLRSRVMEVLALPLESLTLDLERVTFLDSAGLSALIGAAREAEARGVAFGLVGVPAQARRVMDLTDTRALLHVDDTPVPVPR